MILLDHEFGSSVLGFIHCRFLRARERLVCLPTQSLKWQLPRSSIFLPMLAWALLQLPIYSIRLLSKVTFCIMVWLFSDKSIFQILLNFFVFCSSLFTLIVLHTATGKMCLDSPDQTLSIFTQRFVRYSDMNFWFKVLMAFLIMFAATK